MHEVDSLVRTFHCGVAIALGVSPLTDLALKAATMKGGPRAYREG